MRPFFSMRSRLLPAAAVALALAACTSTASSGWTFAPPSATASAAASASGSGAASASASASAPSSGSASASASAPASGGTGGTALQLKAQNIAWDVTSLSAPAKTAFTISLDNEDNGVPHDLAITDSSGKQLFKGDIVTGVATKTYDIPALPAGTYKFACTIHPQMTGQLTVQ